MLWERRGDKSCRFTGNIYLNNQRRVPCYPAHPLLAATYTWRRKRNKNELVRLYMYIYKYLHSEDIPKLQMQSLKLFWPYYLQNTKYLNVLPNSRWFASAPAMWFFIKGDDNWDRAAWILLSTVYIQEPHPFTFLQRTLDVHVDFHEL